MPGEVSPRIPSRGDHAKGLARPPASRGFFLPKPALSLRQSAHGLYAPCRVSDAPKRDDDSTVVAILVYKAVNKAAPCRGGPRRATLVIRGPSDAADVGAVTKGLSKAPAALPPPSWLGGGLFSFGDATSTVNRV